MTWDRWAIIRTARESAKIVDPRLEKSFLDGVRFIIEKLERLAESNSDPRLDKSDIAYLDALSLKHVRKFLKDAKSETEPPPREESE